MSNTIYLVLPPGALTRFLDEQRALVRLIDEMDPGATAIAIDILSPDAIASYPLTSKGFAELMASSHLPPIKNTVLSIGVPRIQQAYVQTRELGGMTGGWRWRTVAGRRAHRSL